MADRLALLVRGGWEGHAPEAATDLFIPFLESHGFEVRVAGSPSVYADAVAMSEVDLLVQCISMGEITEVEVAALRAEIARGMGFTGWHGGIIDSFRASPEYLQLVGGAFATHPADETGSVQVEHRIEITEAGARHPVTDGIDDFTLTTEQYWVLHDDASEVLATTTHAAQHWQPWHGPVTSPAVWTRQWGEGRIVVSTAGHDVDTLNDPNVRTIIERGMLWAARSR